MSTKTKSKRGTNLAEMVDPLDAQSQIRLPDDTRITIPNGMRVAPFRLSEKRDKNGTYKKRPYFSEWNGESDWHKYATADPIQIQKWVDAHPDLILQVIYDNGFILDADMHDLKDGGGIKILREWDKKYGRPETLTVQTPTRKGQKRVFLMPADVTSGRADLRLGRLKEYPFIEILRTSVLWGKGYKTLDASKPTIAPAYLREIVLKPKFMEIKKQYTRTPEQEVMDVMDLIERLDSWRADDYDSWIKVGLILKQMQDQDAGRRLWHTFSQMSPAKYDEYMADKVWDTFQPDGSITLGSLIFWANEDNQTAETKKPTNLIQRTENQTLPNVKSVGDELLNDFLKMELGSLSDWGNAQRLVNLYGNHMRYNPSFNWVIWNGKKWVTDSADAHKYAQETARSIYVEASKIVNNMDLSNAWGRWARQSLSSYHLVKMLEEAKTHLYAETSMFDDNHPWLFNVQNGILDLKTKKLLPHDPTFFITKMAGTYYDPKAKAPKWEAFMAMIFPNESVRRYVQKAAGYSMTGNSDERSVYFLEGHSGNNGKSTTIRVLLEMFGEYGRQTDIEAVMSTSRGGLTPLNEDFYNVRFVATTELPGNMQFSTAKIKSISGDDYIHVNPKHRKPFTFLPTHHLWIFGNHRPQPDKMDDPAFWDRMRQIVFESEIPMEVRRPMEQVLADFREELPGILNWALDGLSIALSEGMRPPEKIVKDTQEYQKETDLFTQFIEETCELNADARVEKNIFLNRYNDFLKANREEPVKMTRLTKDLGTVGVTVGGDGRRYYQGIRIRS
jgi:P4 family phage/plasmid primase-like protien